MLPGDGRNKVFGNNGNDTVSYADLGGSKGVVIDLEDDVFKKAAKGEDITRVENVIGSGNRDKLTPTKGGNAFAGGGDDVLRSELGAVMRGDAGRDKLVGDPREHRKDVFWLQDPGSGPGDLVVNFGGEDSIRLKGSEFGIGDFIERRRARQSRQRTCRVKGAGRS